MVRARRRLTLRRAFTRNRQQVNARARSASPATRPHARHGAAPERARGDRNTPRIGTLARRSCVINRAGFVYPGLAVEPATMAAATTASMTLTTRRAAQGFPARRLGAVTSLRARDARAPILGLPTTRATPSENSSARRASTRARASAAPNDPTPVASTKSGVSAKDTDEEYDVVVIGSGIGGLSAASLLARYGYSVKLFESHYLAGGCCHMFDHRDKDGGLWRFEVGPSIWEGLDRPTGNPLRMVFDALDETMPARTYDGISMWTPEGHWRFQLGDDDAPGGFCDLLREKATDPELAIKEWKALKGRLEPLYDALDACPLTALRQDAGLLLSTVIAIPFYLTHPKVMLDIPYILDSFHKLSRQYVTEPFLAQWIDMLAFFSGYPAEGTMGATMIYSIPGFHRPGASLCAPRAGPRRWWTSSSGRSRSSAGAWS